jgi:hypothetical protein
LQDALARHCQNDRLAKAIEKYDLAWYFTAKKFSFIDFYPRKVLVTCNNRLILLIKIILYLCFLRNFNGDM